MKEVKVYSLDNQLEWDSVVRSFDNYDVCYLSGYSKAFKTIGEGEPKLFYYKDNEVKAIKVFIVRDILEIKDLRFKLEDNECFDIITPYGYGGFWTQGKYNDEIENAFVEYCKNESYVSEFVRFHILSDNYRYYSGDVSSLTQNVVINLELPLDEILANSEYKIRKNLKRATKSELSIELDHLGTRIDDFLNIYYKTMERNNANEAFYFKKEFFEKINMMIGNFVYFYVIKDNEVISTELILYDERSCYSFLGGTLEESFQFRPNEFLKFEVIQWAQNKGIESFILGGGYGSNDGIFKYKRSFAPNSVYDFFVGRRIFDSVKYDELLKLRGIDISNDGINSYFPAYRR